MPLVRIGQVLWGGPNAGDDNIVQPVIHITLSYCLENPESNHSPSSARLSASIACKIVVLEVVES